MWIRFQFIPQLRWFVVLIVMAIFAVTFARVSANVKLESLSAKGEAGKITVSWKTATEINNAGFNVLRSESAAGTFAKVNANLIASNCIGSVAGCSYSYSDTSVTPGKTYYYRLESIETGGAKQTTTPVPASLAAPTATPTTVKTATPTATRTNTTAPTATRTNTSLPPTATNTVPPGFPTLTPVPTATPTPQKVAAAPQSSPTSGRVAGKTFTPAPASPTPLATITPPRIALAPVAPTDSASPEEDSLDQDSEPVDDRRARLVQFTGGGILLGSMMLVGLAFLFFIAATLLFIRAQLRS